MATPDSITDPAFIPWLAGLLEGEGFFGTITSWVDDKPYRDPRIGISMTDRDVIERISVVWNIIIFTMQPTRRATKPQYRVTISGGTAVPWMHAIYPWMGQRRRAQIDAALQEWMTRPDPNIGRRKASHDSALQKTRRANGTFMAPR